MKTLIKLIVAPFKAVATFITILLMLVTLFVVIVSAAFIIRASMPLNKPEFGGLSYFEYLEYREWAQQQNPLLVAAKKQHPEYADASCFRFNLYDDLMVLGLGAYYHPVRPSALWNFFEDGLYQVDFEKAGLRLGRDGGCDIPLTPAIEAWKKTQAQASE